MRLILLGAPGSGKGTQAVLLKAKYGCAHISTGDILRKSLQEETDLSRRVKALMSNGDLVPDDVIIEMVKERLSKDDVTKGFLMDGFPRTVMQAEALDKMLNEIGRPLDAALFINVAENTIVRRLSHRRVCRACGEALNLLDVASETKNCLACSGELYQRDDDSEQVIRKRLQVYRQQTEPVVELYKKKGFLRTVEVQDHYMPEDTFRGVKAALGL